MTNTSAQDDFAKWARLRRQHDKAKEKYDNEGNSTTPNGTTSTAVAIWKLITLPTSARAQESFRGNFNQITTALRFLGTQGVNFIVNTYYTKEPMFWLPQGWVPYQVEWILSFPRAPVGSISVNVWGIACGAVIGMAIEGIVALWTLRTGTVVEGPRKGEKIKMDTVPKVQEKKEL